MYNTSLESKVIHSKSKPEQNRTKIDNLRKFMKLFLSAA